MRSSDNSIFRLFKKSEVDAFDIIDFLEKLKKIDVLDKNKSSVLFYAIEINDVKLIKYLINNGANINQVNDFGVTPLEIAINQGNLSLVKYLFSLGAKINKDGGRNELHISSARGNINLINFYLKYYDIDSEDETGTTPLYFSVQENHFEAIKYLIKRGARVDLKDKNKYDVFLCSVGEGYLHLVKFFLENYFPIFQTEIKEGILLSKSYKHKEIYSYLLEIKHAKK